MNTTAKPRTPLEVLVAAKALISIPDKWIKGDYSGYRKADGSVVETSPDDEPNCFCGYGALYAADGTCAGIGSSTRIRAAQRYLTRAADGRPHKHNFKYSHYPNFNDHPDTTHADVMAVFDKAIALAERVAA